MVSANTSKMQAGQPLENDPKVAALMDPEKRRADKENLARLLAEMSEDNPLKAPDRPHPKPPEVQIVNGELTAVGSSVQAAPTTNVPFQNTPTVLRTAATPMEEVVRLDERPIAQPSVSNAAPSPQPTFETQIQPEPTTPDTTSSDSVSHYIPAPTTRGRGRPLKNAERKGETSYSLSKELIQTLRVEAAHNQIRLKRTVSTSEIVEDLILRGLATIKDHIILDE